MNTSRYSLHPKLAPGFRRLRSSTTTSRASFVTQRSGTSKSETLVATPERLSFCEEDFVDVDLSEIVETNTLSHPQVVGQESGRTDSTRTFLTRSRSSLSRIRSLSRRNSSKQQTLVPSQPLGEQRPKETSLVPYQYLQLTRRSIDFPGESVATLTQPTASGLGVVREIILNPDQITPSPPSSGIATPTTLAPSAAISGVAVNPLQKSLKRLRTLAKGRLFTSRNPAPEVCQILPNPNPGASPATDREASPQSSQFLPELSFDPTPLSVLIQEKGEPAEQEHTPQASPQPDSHLTLFSTLPSSNLPLVKYEFVKPSELTASPAETLLTRYSIAATPLPPSSPSWLSRNVQELELLARQIQPRLRIEPHSPDPLPVLLHSTRLSRSISDSLPPTPQSANSSLTLNVSHNRLSLSVRSRGSSVNRLSILRYRQSVAESRKSIQSFITCASVAFPDEKVEALASVPEKPQFFLLLHPPSPEAQSSGVPAQLETPSLSPLDFDSSNPLLRLPSVVPPTPIDNSPSSLALVPPIRTYDIFIPSQSPHEPDEPSPLPPYLLTLAKSIVRSPSIMSTYSASKPNDHVDFGEEEDYSGYEWFKDPPPRAEPRAQSSTEPYVPQPGVIEQNDMFDYALKSAPNVLYGRFKQYGQLGVLAWCSEFGELIDALKSLGFDGNMFVSTRKQALATCDQILKLDLQIEMQIIVMYLSSQVARLRRFLDHEQVWTDYPRPNFPSEPPHVVAYPTS
ncbi:hypothetical protein EIP91_000573 [Steccherinum ochraceum]|uniref:Uncharacterized protein n=1 Tax=Steccherinum ochraceum TaxID=92696 RepID=A0A4R0RFL0_9APHY|nr:hypothetical protein EIP91_000573 [Steccherinum ochraceum]